MALFFFFLNIVCAFLSGSVLAEKKVWTVAICADTQPFSFQEAGRFVGLEIELVQELAKRMGAEVVFKDMDFSALIPAVTTGHATLAVGLITPTAQRRKKVDFSLPYHRNQVFLLTRDPVNPEEFFRQECHIGVQMGAIYGDKLKEISNQNQSVKLTVKVYNRLSDMAQDLKGGRLEGIVLDDASSLPLKKTFGFSSAPLRHIFSEGFCLMLPKNSPLTKAVNTTLLEIEKEGTLEAFKTRWFASLKEGASEPFWKDVLFILSGLKVTLFYTFFSLCAGGLLGLGLTVLRLSPRYVFSAFAQIYVSLFRGVPLLLQLWLIYFGLGNTLSVWQAGLLAFSLNSAAYLSEIMRAGIQSIDQGQWEAGAVLGVPRWKVLRDIIFPQALQKQVPSFVNEAADLLKESALISTIAEADLMRRAATVAAHTFDYWKPYLVAGSCYYVMVFGLSELARLLERQLSRRRSR
jgi:His/Glu/Gln/Arg/opine family amino acid ABC transporter permease subunit